MRIALTIHRLAPRGGLEDHCIRIGETLAARGHDVAVLTTVPAPVAGATVERIRSQAWRATNHGRLSAFAREVGRIVAHGGFDLVVGFQAMPGLDVLYCADMPRWRPADPWWRRATPRRLVLAQLERACFRPDGSTRIVLLSAVQREAYLERYGTPAARLALVPPSIDRAKRRPELRETQARSRARALLGLSGGPVWLWLGLHPRTKGLDRVLSALAAERQAALIIGGLAESDPKAAWARRDIGRLGLGGRVRWLGYLDAAGVSHAFAAADALAHPARADVTGGVILEALINGLPAVVTENCGFAPHVRASGAGVVLRADPSPKDLTSALAFCAGPNRDELARLGTVYGERAKLYSGIEVAADLIEQARWGDAVDEA